ncbi:hypothetical protein D3C76_1168290 [compost metagenome]
MIIRRGLLDGDNGGANSKLCRTIYFLPMLKNVMYTLVLFPRLQLTGGSNGLTVFRKQRNRAVVAELDILNLLLILVVAHGDQEHSL